MPSKYAKKLPKPVTKQDADLPYKKHWKPELKREMCANCGYKGLWFQNSSAKCSCGGTFTGQGMGGRHE